MTTTPTTPTAATPEELAAKLDHMSDISLLYSPNDAVDLGNEAAAMIRAQAAQIAELTAKVCALTDQAATYRQQIFDLHADIDGPMAAKVQGLEARATQAEAAMSAMTKERDEAQAETKLIQQNAADAYSLIDHVADKIGLPHDQELSDVAFDLWLSAALERETAMREALTGLADVMEGDCGVEPCVGSMAPAEHYLGLARAALQPKEPSHEWTSLSNPPPEAGRIDVRSACTYRWRAYSHSSDQYKRWGRRGRWQQLTERGWMNADLPESGEWRPNEAPQPKEPPPCARG